MVNITYDGVLNAPAFVIHMEKAAERKPFFMRNIEEAGFTDIQIYSAINAYDVDDLTKALNYFGNPKIHSNLGKGQTGCLLSHLSVLLHIVQNNISIATIFEDDVHFHPHWANLAPGYFKNTPTDFDILFIGNQLDECLKKTSAEIPRINRYSTFCTHAYIVTHKGAQKLIQLLLSWDWWSVHAGVVEAPPNKLDGLFCIDIMIKNIQERILNGQLNAKILKWYCWCGMHYVCEDNMLPLKDMKVRNTGLVFQCDKFPSLIYIKPQLSQEPNDIEPNTENKQ